MNNNKKMTANEFRRWWLKGKIIDAKTAIILSDFVKEFEVVNKLKKEGKIVIPMSDYKV